MENTKYQAKPKSRKVRESVVPQSGPLLTPRDLWDSFYASMRQAYPSGLPSDRKHGQNWPVIRNDYDLRQARAFSRLLADTNPLVIGFLDHITNFVVGSGFKWAVGLKGAEGDSPQEKKDPSVIRVRGVLDDWRALNGWGAQHEITFGDFTDADDSPPTDMEAEAWRSSMRDGEFLLRLFPGTAGTNGIPSVRRVNPECVYVPPGQNPEGPWSFGIETDPDDRQRRLNYHVADPDRYPTDGEIVPAREVVHFKLNVDSDVKRGVPDFWPLEHEAQHLRKSWQNIAEVVAVLSAIAYIRQHAPGVSTTQISNMLDRIKSGTDHNSAKWADTLQGSDIYRQFTRHEGGTVIDITGGMQYESAPAVSGMPGFVQGMQAALRIFGLRWGCPEYFSGDSSNANFASTLVAGGPFERAAQRRQQAFARFQGTVIHRVLLFAVQSGRLTKEDVARVAVKVQPPAVAIANKAEDTQRRSALYQAGVLSKRTWCAEEGLDPDLELALRKQEDAEAQAQQQPPGGGGDPPPEQPQPAGPTPPAPDAGGGFSGEDFASIFESAPGPPPRPGLVWNDQTRRWRNPETDVLYAHPRGHEKIAPVQTEDIWHPALGAHSKLLSTVQRVSRDTPDDANDQLLTAVGRATKYAQTAAKKILAAVAAEASKHLPPAVVEQYAAQYATVLRDAYQDYSELADAVADADPDDRTAFREAASAAQDALSRLLTRADEFGEFIKQKERHRPDHPDDPYHKPRPVQESKQPLPPEFLAAMVAAYDAGDMDAVGDLMDLADDPEALAAVLDGTVTESVTTLWERMASRPGWTWSDQSKRWTKDQKKARPERKSAPGQSPKEQLVARKAAAEPARQAARAAWAAAVEKGVTAAQLPELAGHLGSLTRDELRTVAAGLAQRVGGLKQQLVDRLLAKVGVTPEPTVQAAADSSADKPAAPQAEPAKAGADTTGGMETTPPSTPAASFSPAPSPSRTNTKGDVFDTLPDDQKQSPSVFVSGRDKLRALDGETPFGDDGRPKFRGKKDYTQDSLRHGAILATDDGKVRVYGATLKNGKPLVTFIVGDEKDVADGMAVLKAAGLDPAEHVGDVAARTFGTGERPFLDRVNEYLRAGGVEPPEPPKKQRPKPAADAPKRVSGGQIDGELVGVDSQRGASGMRYTSRRLKGGGTVLGVGDDHPDGVVTDVAVSRTGKVTYTVKPRTPAEEAKRQAAKALADKWTELAGHTATEVWPDELQGQLSNADSPDGWTPIDPPPANRFGHGSRRYVGRLKDGRLVGRTVHVGMDDYREVFHLPST